MPFRAILYLCACMSTLHAPRATLSPSEAVDVDRCNRAASEVLRAYPWLVGVQFAEDTPGYLMVQLTSDAPINALDIVASDYAQRSESPHPVWAMRQDCTAWVEFEGVNICAEIGFIGKSSAGY